MSPERFRQLIIIGVVSLVWTFQTLPTFAQDPESGSEPAEEPAPEVVNWTPPAWVMDKDQAEDFRRRKRLDISRQLKSNAPSAQQESQFRQLVDYYMSGLILEEKANLPQEVIDRLIALILSDLQTSDAAAEIMLDEVVKKAPDLMTHPDPIVRYNTVLLVARTSTEKAQISPPTPEIPYNPAHNFLIDVLKDSNQLTDCRIVATRGLERICRDGVNFSSNERSDVAIALTETLKSIPVDSADENWWFRFRIANALGYVDRLDNVARDPIVLNALMDMIKNAKEKPINRTQAALSLSRLPWTGSTPVREIVYATNKLLNDMVTVYQKRPDSPIWRPAFSRIYLAYRPADAREAGKNWGMLYQINRPGVGQFSGVVNTAWPIVFEVTKPIVANDPPGKVPPAAAKALSDWVKDNVP